MFDVSGPVHTGLTTTEIPAMWIGYQEVAGTPSCGNRGIALAHLLSPAFQAGVGSAVRHYQRKESLGRILDMLQEGILLISADGTLLHENAAMRGMLSADVEAPLIKAMVRSVRDAMMVLLREPTAKSQSPDPAASFVREVRTRKAAYTIRGNLVPEGLFATRRSLMIVLECHTPELPTEASVRERWGLTRAQAKVALLVTTGKTNDAIARDLFISPHTVRRHVEQVRLKLGVSSRAAFTSMILTR